jgi:CubicO group peptidase (beta-lactamase class C family)
VRDDTIARIYSMTKPVTSVALMMLVEQGLVMLDDPVGKHLPAFERVQVVRGGGEGGRFETEAPAEPVRVVDLLRHTSG